MTGSNRTNAAPTSDVGSAAQHAPVMLQEMLSALAPTDNGTFLDGTFGAGGYSKAVLQSVSCRVFAIDRDPDAIARATPILQEFGDRFQILKGRFSDMTALLSDAGVQALDGIVLDIGVSSPQIDTPERGFSFRFDGPLDMRMSGTGTSAADIVNNWDEVDLARLIRNYGEEKRARAVARAIVAARGDTPITTTFALADIIRRVVRKSKDGIDPATRTFQALRIEVNDELGELDRALVAAEKLLVPGGRLVVVAFHSLEDKRVKSFLTARSGGTGISRHMPGPDPAQKPPTFELPQRKSVKPSLDEQGRNPRARSARLRLGIRTANPAWPSSTAKGGLSE